METSILRKGGVDMHKQFEELEKKSNDLLKKGESVTCDNVTIALRGIGYALLAIAIAIKEKGR